MNKSDISIPATPDKCAVKAEGQYRKVCTFGRQRLLAALDVGLLMTEAKKQLVRGKWEPTVKQWRENGTITFSERSLRRWMLMAKYEMEIISASLADLSEAEKYAQDKEKSAKEAKATGETGTGEKRARGKADRNPKDEFEDGLVRTIQKMSEEERRDYLQYVIETASKHLALY